MNFFERQDKARSRTGFLVLLYLLTIVLTILAVYPVARLLMYFVENSDNQTSYSSNPLSSLWPINSELFCTISIFITLMVLMGALYKILQLSQGGKCVAELLGGIRILPDTTDPNERKILNVVEEMAIASGTAVPPVYLLPREQAINAFAAGFSTRDAVIGVTRGSVELLSRDELQGVMAHEFSHILNGDMRLNLQLMGGIHGILIIAILGRILMESAGRGSSRSSGRNSGGGRLILFLGGLGLFLIGWAGVFFARVLKCAVSRQREILADSSAVQFTRYPEGLAGALKKIGGLTYGSIVEHPKSEEASHFYFANGIKLDFVSHLFATHPPLIERIRLLDPAFDGKFKPLSNTSTQDFSKTSKVSSSAPTQASAFAPEANPAKRTGIITDKNLSYAANLIREIPGILTSYTRSPSTALGVIFALLMDRNDPAVRNKQKTYLVLNWDPRLLPQFNAILNMVDSLDIRFRLPLAELCVPALSMLSDNQFQTFISHLENLIMADNRVQPFEAALEILVRRHTEAFYRKSKQQAQPSAVTVEAAKSKLMSLLTAAGEGNASLPENLTNRAEIYNAIIVMEKTRFKDRENFLTECAEAIKKDGLIRIEELEILRAISDALDCPIPPLE